MLRLQLTLLVLLLVLLEPEFKTNCGSSTDPDPLQPRSAPIADTFLAEGVYLLKQSKD